MGRKLALECRRCGGHIPLYAALAFVTAFCGILLWVNGVAAPIVFRIAVIPCAVLGLTGHFVLWLILYGLFGWLLGMLLTTPGISCVEPSLTVIAYTLCLAWYPVFFSLLHTAFALLLLLISLTVSIILLLRCLRRTILCTICTLSVLALEIGFFGWTVLFLVRN